MNKNLFESIVGALILAVVVALIYYVVNMVNKDDKERYILFAHFDDVSGITVGSDVTIGGIVVGKVKSTIFDYGKQAVKVEFSLPVDVQIPIDSSLQISSNSIMGDKVIKIYLGSSHNLLKAGQEIEHTESHSGIESLFKNYLFN